MKLLVLLTLSLIVVGCTKKSVADGLSTSAQNSISIQAGRMGHKPWDPRASYTTQVTLFNAIFTPLVRINRFYEISPGIFIDWYWDDEKSQYEFTVDTSLKFSEDRVLKLTDIEFAFLKGMLTNQDDANKIDFSEIVGSELVKPGAKYKTGLCSGISINGSNKIIIKLKKRNPLFVYKLSELMSPVAPVEDFEDDYITFKAVPRGTGNYAITWSDPDSTLIKLELKKNANVPQPFNGPRVVHFYSHGTSKEHNVDISIGVSNDALRGDDRYRQIIGDFASVMNVLDFNYNNDLGKNILFRKAVSHAINRDAFVDLYDDASGTHEITLPDHYGFSGTKFSYDPQLSREIIAEFFKDSFSKENPIQARFHGPLNLAEKKKYVKILEKNFSDVGLYVNFKPFEMLSFKKGEKTEEIAFVIYGLATSFVDPLSAFKNYRAGSVLVANFDASDEKAKELYKLGFDEANREEKAKIIRALTTHYQTQYSFLPLLKFAPRFMVKKSTIKGIGIEKIQYSLDISNVELVRQ